MLLDFGQGKDIDVNLVIQQKIMPHDKTVITVSKMKALKKWKEKYPNLKVISK